VSTRATALLESTTRSAGAVIATAKTAFCAGSSQQGKHRRASVASNCVTAIQRSSPRSLYFDLHTGTHAHTTHNAVKQKISVMPTMRRRMR